MTTPLDYRSSEADVRRGVHIPATIVAGIGLTTVGVICWILTANDAPGTVLWVAPLAGLAAGLFVAHLSRDYEVAASLIAGSIPAAVVGVLLLFAICYFGPIPLHQGIWESGAMFWLGSWAIYALPAWLSGGLLRQYVRRRLRQQIEG